MLERICRVCHHPINPERLEVLPDTQTCTAHSTTAATIGFMVPTAAKGCAPVLHVVPNNNEALRQARRANKRSR